jgi:hypothetical protein
MAPEPTRMYYGGPLRLFSTERFLGGIPYHGGEFTGFSGMFICAQCRIEVPRVLFERADWICRDCSAAWKRAGRTA